MKPTQLISPASKILSKVQFNSIISFCSKSKNFSNAFVHNSIWSAHTMEPTGFDRYDVNIIQNWSQ